MPEDITTTTSEAEVVTQQEQQQEQAATPEPKEQDGDHEAAKYRRRLRDTEAERDTLAAQLAAIRREQVEELVSNKLHRPADFFEIGEVSLDELLDSEGRVDKARVEERITAITRERSYLLKPANLASVNTAVPSRGATDDRGDVSWQDAISVK